MAKICFTVDHLMLLGKRKRTWSAQHLCFASEQTTSSSGQFCPLNAGLIFWKPPTATES